MNDDQYFLANAYLDGELTADERRFAEADPEVMTEVEQLRALQAELRDAPPPSAAARESAIDAALADFAADGAPTASTPRTETPPAAAIPLRPRPAYAKYLGIAAAVVAVAGLGIIVSQTNLGGDDDDATADVAAEARVADDTAEQGALIESLDSADESVQATAEMAADAGGDAATAMVDEEAAAEMSNDMAESTVEDTAEMAAADTDASSAGATSTAQRWIVGPRFDAEAPILDERDLGIYGVYLLDERDAERLPPSPNTSCGDDEILDGEILDDEILDTATVVIDEVPTLAYISVVEADGLVFARDTETCDVVLAGSVFVG